MDMNYIEHVRGYMEALLDLKRVLDDLITTKEFEQMQYFKKLRNENIDEDIDEDDNNETI